MTTIPSAPVDWRPIPGWEGYYEVSSAGQVRSVRRCITNALGQVRWLPSRMLAPQPHSTKGYLHVNPARGGKAVSKSLHALVALAFLGPRPDGFQVAHNDGDPRNNAADNLRYATPSENEMDKWRHGTNREALRPTCRKGHPFSPANTYRDKNGWRVCRTCRNAASKAAPSRQRKRAA